MQVAKFDERVKGRAFQARVEGLARASTPEQRAAIRGDLEALAAWVKGALATFKKKA